MNPWNATVMRHAPRESETGAATTSRPTRASRADDCGLRTAPIGSPSGPTPACAASTAHASDTHADGGRAGGVVTFRYPNPGLRLVRLPGGLLREVELNAAIPWTSRFAAAPRSSPPTCAG
jgi:hypothetical protein